MAKHQVEVDAPDAQRNTINLVSIGRPAGSGTVINERANGVRGSPIFAIFEVARS